MITIVLLPGMDGTSSLFSEFADALGAEFEVIMVRYPVDEPLDYLALEKIAHAHLPSDRPFVLLGESFSGPIAISLAAATPQGLMGLVLCCSFARNPRPLLGNLPLIERFPIKRVPVRLANWFLMGRYASDALCGAFEKAISLVSEKTFHARMRAVLSVDVSEKLKRLHLPVLYLHGTEDRVVPRSAAEWICDLVPHARLADLVGPHCLLQAVPIEAAAVVKRFSREIEVERAGVVKK